MYHRPLTLTCLGASAYFLHPAIRNKYHKPYGSAQLIEAVEFFLRKKQAIRPAYTNSTTRSKCKYEVRAVSLRGCNRSEKSYHTAILTHVTLLEFLHSEPQCLTSRDPPGLIIPRDLPSSSSTSTSIHIHHHETPIFPFSTCVGPLGRINYNSGLRGSEVPREPPGNERVLPKCAEYYSVEVSIFTGRGCGG